MHDIVMNDPAVVGARETAETWRARAAELRQRCDDAARSHKEAKAAALMRGEAFAPALVPIDPTEVDEHLRDAERALPMALRAAGRRRLPQMRSRERDILRGVLDSKVRDLPPLVEELELLASTMKAVIDARSVQSYLDSGDCPQVTLVLADVIDAALSERPLLDAFAAKLEPEAQGGDRTRQFMTDAEKNRIRSRC